MTTTTTLRAPRGNLLYGHLAEFQADKLGFLTCCAREYGDRVPLRLGSRRLVLLSHPNDIEAVLTNNRDFIKHWYLQNTRAFLGRGLLTSEGDFWLRQRRLAQPAFHRKRVAAYADVMVNYTERMLATWHDDEQRDVHHDMMLLTLDIVAKTLFDADTSAEAAAISHFVETGIAAFDKRMSGLVVLPPILPTPNNLRQLRIIQQLHRTVQGFIDQRHTTGDDHGDLLSMLLQARDEDGSRMSDKQVRDEVMTLFLAGHETTALALSWVWYLLAQHPAAEATLLAELDTVLGGRAPTMDDLPNLVYTSSVIKEGLRLYPPAAIVGREVVRDCTINGLPVAAGTTIFMSQWVVQRDERFFTNANAFMPERWADGLAKRLPKYAYFPFSGGARICIGQSFAEMELALVLATIAQQFRLSLVPGQRVEPQATFTLRPRNGIQVMLQRRG